MTLQRLDELLRAFGRARVAVVGDFFLDKYLEIDPALTETSLETGLEARQVVAVRCQPGGAGNVAASLCALGVGEAICLGFIGDDGDGFELTRALRKIGANTGHLIPRSDRHTPTYCKPMLRLPDGRRHELERLDTKNRTPIPAELEAELIARLGGVAPTAGAVVIQDQGQEAECGAVTSNLREALARLLRAHPGIIGLADSRLRTGEFRGIVTKPNRPEACAAIHPDTPAHRDEQALCCAAALSRRTGAPVLLTMGSEGAAVVTAESAQRLPTIRLGGQLDIVGAGDSFGAGAVLALSSGASLAEAAIIGNIVASVTIQQIGTTGSATQRQVQERFSEHEQVWRELPPAERMLPTGRV